MQALDRKPAWLNGWIVHIDGNPCLGYCPMGRRERMLLRSRKLLWHGLLAISSNAVLGVLIADEVSHYNEPYLKLLLAASVLMVIQLIRVVRADRYNEVLFFHSDDPIDSAKFKDMALTPDGLVLYSGKEEPLWGKRRKIRKVALPPLLHSFDSERDLTPQEGKELKSICWRRPFAFWQLKSKSPKVVRINHRCVEILEGTDIIWCVNGRPAEWRYRLEKIERL